MDNLNMKPQFVSEPQLDKNSIIYDPSSGEVPAVLPNVESILDEIIKILECMNTEEMQVIKSTNEPLFNQLMEDKFPQFVERYYSIFKKVLSGEDLNPLFKMLDVIGNINTGQTSFETGEKTVGSYLTKFLPNGLLEKINSGEITPEMLEAKQKKRHKKK
jgi:hypothetical protein